jgi:hypothetical protein
MQKLQSHLQAKGNYSIIHVIAEEVLTHTYVVPKSSNRSVASCESSTYLSVINSQIRKRKIFQLIFKGSIEGKFHQVFLGFYGKLLIFSPTFDGFRFHAS